MAQNTRPPAAIGVAERASTPIFPHIGAEVQRARYWKTSVRPASSLSVASVGGVDDRRRRVSRELATR